MRGDCISCRWHLSSGGDDQGICFCDERGTSSLQSLGDDCCEHYMEATGMPDCRHCKDTGLVCAYCGERKKLCGCTFIDGYVFNPARNVMGVEEQDSNFVACPKCSGATLTKTDLRAARRYLRGEVRQ
jgi:hypothetical protein